MALAARAALCLDELGAGRGLVMRGQVYEFRGNLGVGRIVGEDGVRYRFHKDHLAPGVLPQLGAAVEFTPNGKEADRISMLPPGTQVQIAPPLPPPVVTPAQRRQAAATHNTAPSVSQDEEAKRRRIKAYFEDESVFAALLSIVFGIATLIYVLGALFIYNGAKILWRKGTRPTDAQVSAWTAADIPDAVARAKMVGSIGPTAMAPLEIRHAVAGTLLGDAKSYQLLGEDFVWRYSPQGISVLLLGDQEACIYQCAIDLTTGVSINERVYEFFYQDVVDISWQNQTETIDFREFGFMGRQVKRLFAGLIPDAKQKRRVMDTLRYVGRLRQQHQRYVVDKILQRNLFTTFVVTLQSGHAIEIPVFDGRPAAEVTRGTGPDPNGARALLEVARAFIREKKLMLLGASGARAPSAPII